MWFTENPWPPMFLLGAAAIVLGGLWTAQKRGAWLAAAAVCLLAVVGIYVFEGQVVTDRERVTASLLKMAQAFQQKDADATLAFISRQAAEVRELATTALKDVEVKGALSIKSIDVTMHNENSQADSVFRANGNFTYQGTYSSYGSSRWLVRWRKEAGEWKVVEVQRMGDDDEPMAPFEARR